MTVADRWLVRPIGVVRSLFREQDGTPVLDLKPYVPSFDAFPGLRAGWLDDERIARKRADRRFEPEQ